MSGQVTATGATRAGASVPRLAELAEIAGRSRGRRPRRARASIVVPVHGHAALTKACLDAVLAELPAGCELIVVDDASPDHTAQLLAGYGERIRVVTLNTNGGYAVACNTGAELAAGRVLVFLNNDTRPHPNWLAALLTHAREHPAASVVGAKLVYPNGTVQHAGVAIGQDGYPHNLYAGLPAEHPAVCRSRVLQAVTGACMLVRSDAFEQAGGFDTGYLNSLEDVDLCLRIGRAGGEVHYCHRAILTHLESASRGRDERFQRSVARYRRRWRDRVRRDDLQLYAEDGLLALDYRDAYPQRLSVSPRLAVVDQGREREAEALLGDYAEQVSRLLAEVMRLTALVGVANTVEPAPATAPPLPPRRQAAPCTAPDHGSFLAEAGRLEEQALLLQQRLAGAPREGAEDAPPAFAPNRRLGYRRFADRVCAAVADAVPAGSRLLVVSRGDAELVRVRECEARHFPQAAGGGYLGYHPRDSEDAIRRLEDLRAAGAQYLVLPSVSSWWLEHYVAFAEHLCRHPWRELGVCRVYALTDAAASALLAREQMA